MKIFNLILALLFLSSCNSRKNLEGMYRSNKIELGFFVTTLELKNSTEFNYTFSGDLVHTELSGMYKLKENNLYLKFNRNKGEVEATNDSTALSEILSGNYHNYNLKRENDIDYHLKYKIRKNKLFVYRSDNNKLVKRSKVYTNQKKFLLFGSQWKNKKIYLRKIKSYNKHCIGKK